MSSPKKLNGTFVNRFFSHINPSFISSDLRARASKEVLVYEGVDAIKHVYEVASSIGEDDESSRSENKQDYYDEEEQASKRQPLKSGQEQHQQHQSGYYSRPNILIAIMILIAIAAIVISIKIVFVIVFNSD